MSMGEFARSYGRHDPEQTMAFERINFPEPERKKNVLSFEISYDSEF